jgi:ATP-dependent helicase HrpA
VPEGFLAATPSDRLEHFPRYLKAISLRLKKLATSGLARDRQSHDIVAVRWQAYRERAQDHQRRRFDDPARAEFRWLVEELRVSLFAQELGTSQSVSPQRLDKQWAKVRI